MHLFIPLTYILAAVAVIGLLVWLVTKRQIAFVVTGISLYLLIFSLIVEVFNLTNESWIGSLGLALAMLAGWNLRRYWLRQHTS